MRVLTFCIFCFFSFVSSVFCTQNVIVLQEGKNQYTGCADALILNEGGKYQMEQTNKDILNPETERTEIVFFAC